MMLKFFYLNTRNVSKLSALLFAALLGLVLSAEACAQSVTKEFILKDTAGQQHALKQYQGKWVLVNYWATWCTPCLEEVADYVDDMLMSYPIILGDEEVIDQIGTAEVLPTTFFYNPKGELVKIKRGLVTRQYIEKIIGSSK